MLTILEGIDYSALIIGLITLTGAYYKTNKKSRDNDNTIIKDYVTEFIDDLNNRNKELEERLDRIEEKYQKCMDKIYKEEES
jgi:hypothetical protein